MEQLKDMIARNEERNNTDGDWKGRVEELEDENDRLRAELEAQDNLVDENEQLRLQLEELQRRHEASTLERSQSRAQIVHAQEEMEAFEDDLNSVRDKLAASQIELSQKDDEIEMKNREMDELVDEHRQIVDQVEQEWKGEVDEARGQIEDLKDVSPDILIIRPSSVSSATGFGPPRHRISGSSYAHHRTRGQH